MKLLPPLLLACLLASGSLAGLDPDTDSFGVYFDTAGNTNCTMAAPFQPITAYLLLMNPAGPTDGFECTVAMTGAPHVILSTNYCGSTICDGEHCGPYSFAIGCATGFPVLETGAAVLVTWQIMLQSTAELLFHVGPGAIPSLPGGLPVVTGDGVLRLCRVASGDVELPVAGINAGANCPVGDEASSFGGVKGLFR